MTQDAAALPSGEAQSAGRALREQAIRLLERAQALDGLKPFLVRYEHGQGVDAGIAWARHMRHGDARNVADFFCRDDFNPMSERFEADALELGQMAGVFVVVPDHRERAAPVVDTPRG